MTKFRDVVLILTFIAIFATCADLLLEMRADQKQIRTQGYQIEAILEGKLPVAIDNVTQKKIPVIPYILNSLQELASASARPTPLPNIFGGK